MNSTKKGKKEIKKVMENSTTFYTFLIANSLHWQYHFLFPKRKKR